MALVQFFVWHFGSRQFLQVLELAAAQEGGEQSMHRMFRVENHLCRLADSPKDVSSSLRLHIAHLARQFEHLKF